MTQSKYMTPRLGYRSASILGLMLVGAITLVVHYNVTRVADTFVSESTANSQFAIRMWLTGLIYGLTAGGCWLATFVTSRYPRWLTRAALVIVLALAWDRIAPDSWLRHLANLGGLAVSQCMLFAWLRIPDWEPAASGDSMFPDDPKRFQYGIGDVGIATTCVALLLGIVIRYPPPTDPSWYWSVLVSCWMLGPLITACVARSILDRHQIRLGYGLLAIGMSVIGVAALSAAELLLIQPNLRARPATIQLLASLYGRLILGYVLTFAAFAVAARVQGVPAPRDELDS